MSNRKMTLVVLFALSVSGFLVMNRYVIAKPSLDQETKRKWEYCHLYASVSNGESYHAQIVYASTPAGRIDEIDSSYAGVGALNKLGAEGWEVVGIIPTQSPGPEFILKRPKP
jgi:maleate cis-trans isomerase